ncbi:unnamed protein product [Acanthoscelides obtectus]|uniref:Transposase n=1 Tax=Acanthoscelides obtectus TaxID=200917 RepID=A0A9P0P5L5_ACAOB|nr:unnamed protein product [Acanthoscelides obtectus]CAK1675286.1 Histone-lysine N-methyltransferase SETMAR [Acanthoscelides obtectus]
MENVNAVRKLIIEDRHVTFREIEASLKISKTSIKKKLHEELGVKKLVSRWIPHLLTEQQKTLRVNSCQKTLHLFNSGNSKNVYSIASGDESWIYCEEKPTKMVATFVSKAGHIATIPLNEQRTVTADWYTTICLPKVITELRKINPERRIILHQDNASSHTAQKTRQYSTKENVLDHPPYSPDLSPNDFFTFPKIKNRLRGQRFQSPEEAVDAFKNAVLDLPAFADEAHFHLDGFVNRQNCRIWAVTFFLPKLNDIDVPNMWFQQDDISRSCDLTPLDFFLWETSVNKYNPSTIKNTDTSIDADELLCIHLVFKNKRINKISLGSS